MKLVAGSGNWDNSPGNTHTI